MALVEIDTNGDHLTPKSLRRRGLRAAYAFEIGINLGDSAAERNGRAVLEYLVDAFLHDRTGNADLFARAHAVGRRLSDVFGCRWTPGDESYTLNCPIYGLHRPFGHSIAMNLITDCSICGAGDLQCQHVPGREYDGDTCYRVVVRMGGLGHVAFTPDPDFIYTFHQPQQANTKALVRDGVIKRAGDPARCLHCKQCRGEPDDGDLDPVGRYERLRAEWAREHPTSTALGKPD